MKVLLWHVHGSWTTALVRGPHEYVVPVLQGRGADGRGRARTYEWPQTTHELTPAELADTDVDLVILQRPRDLVLCEEWLGRSPGRDLPAIYVEHNAPQGRIVEMGHLLAGRDDIPLVHVTHFNDLFWDSGEAPTRVIEHGIVDPGYRYTGEIPEAAVAINEPVRRGRVTGTDLLPRLNGEVTLRVFGIGAGELGGVEDPPQSVLHAEMARRRAYLHPFRWTSLGLSLLEAMHLGMPVVALATTEVVEAVPPEAGFVSNDISALREGLRELVADPFEAQRRGLAARAAVRERYGLDRFLAEWDELLEAVA